MRIGLYGGSFDPIHYGHIRPVREARDTLALDRVLYLPTARAPHKPRREVPALARFCMVELALLDEPRMHVSSLELEDRVTYTIETLQHFHRLEPAGRLFLILGSDSLAQFDTWCEWRQILQLAELAVLERPGGEAPSGTLPEALRSALSTTRLCTRSATCRSWPPPPTFGAESRKAAAISPNSYPRWC